MKYCTLTLWGTAEAVNATLMTARQQGIPFLGGWTKTNTPSRTYMRRVAVSTGTVGVRVRLRERDRALFSLNAVCRVVPHLTKLRRTIIAQG